MQNTIIQCELITNINNKYKDFYYNESDMITKKYKPLYLKLNMITYKVF